MNTGWRWLRSLRFRITAIATVAFAAVLILVGFFAAGAQNRRLIDTIDDSLRETIAEVEVALDLAAQPRRPSPRRPRLEDELSQRLAIAVSKRPLQLISADGEVMASSAALQDLPPLVEVDSETRGFRTVSNPFGDGEDRYRVAVLDVGGEGGEVLVAARSLEEIDAAGSSLRSALLVGVPLLIAAMGWLIWMVTGRALAPVEKIRSEVDEITASQLDRRVSVPTSLLELEGLATTMNQMLDRLDMSARRQDRFVADASHELRSPLAGIRSQLEVNIAHPDQADWSEAGSEVLSETVRMQRLVDDLLALARAETAVPSADVAVDLDDLVLAEAARLRDRGVQVDSTRVSAAQVRARRDELERVFRNLADNAGRHATSEVRFSVAELADRVEVEIRDDGPGIPSEESETIFERFSRLDEARDRDSGGSGLGLAIARELVERNRGSLSLTTSQPDGACFLVVFPSVEDREIPRSGTPDAGLG